MKTVHLFDFISCPSPECKQISNLYFESDDARNPMIVGYCCPKCGEICRYRTATKAHQIVNSVGKDWVKVEAVEGEK
jgi:hypothetical protein